MASGQIQATGTFFHNQGHNDSNGLSIPSRLYWAEKLSTASEGKRDPAPDHGGCSGCIVWRCIPGRDLPASSFRLARLQDAAACLRYLRPESTISVNCVTHSENALTAACQTLLQCQRLGHYLATPTQWLGQYMLMCHDVISVLSIEMCILEKVIPNPCLHQLL